MFEIPVRNDLPSYSMDVDLNGSSFRLEFRFNARMKRWILDILDTQGNEILKGKPLLTGVPILLSHYYNQSIPYGEFFLLDIKETFENCETMEDLGDRFKFYFLEA